jgi:hypothetical protein
MTLELMQLASYHRLDGRSLQPLPAPARPVTGHFFSIEVSNRMESCVSGEFPAFHINGTPFARENLSTTKMERTTPMKTFKRFMAVATIGTLSSTCCFHATDVLAGDGSLSTSPYRAQELSIDGFGTGSIGQETIDNLSSNTVKQNGRLGAGGGLNYFLTRCIGIGGDAYTENTADHFIDSASGNLIARLPLGETGVAPYIFGGGGHQFDEVAQNFGQAGVGIELRFMEHAGIFIDARYVFADKTDNYGVGRAGLRINF